MNDVAISARRERSRLRKSCKMRKSLRKRVRQRDGDMCWICGKAMSFDHPASNRSATLDHILPLKCGGATTMGNLKLAHRLCNQRRGSPASM